MCSGSSGLPHLCTADVVAALGPGVRPVPPWLPQTGRMSKVRAATTADPARWLRRSDVDWWDLVRYGPPGFEVYLRIALAHGADGGGEDGALRTALATLAGHTSTPASGYAAIWVGWTNQGSAPSAPRVPIPNRTMLLFAGPVGELRDAP